MVIVEFNNVSKRIGKKDLLKDVSLRVESGEIFGLLGPNGAGKTTIIRLMIDLLKPTYGEVLWYGDNKSSSFKEKLGLIMHDDGLYLSMSGLNNLKFFGSLQNGIDEDEIINVLKEVELFDAINSPVSTYSLGMKKRLCLARCILRKPEIIVLDEPTAGLDIDGKHWFIEKVKEFKKRGVTVIISSHDLNEIEAICTHVAIIREGTIKVNGSISEILNSNNDSIESLYLKTGETDYDQEKHY